MSPQCHRLEAVPKKGNMRMTFLSSLSVLKFLYTISDHICKEVRIGDFCFFVVFIVFVLFFPHLPPLFLSLILCLPVLSCCFSFLYLKLWIVETSESMKGRRTPTSKHSGFLLLHLWSNSDLMSFNHMFCFLGTSKRESQGKREHKGK